MFSPHPFTASYWLRYGCGKNLFQWKQIEALYSFCLEMSYVNLFLLLAGEGAAAVSFKWNKWLMVHPCSFLPVPILMKQQRSWPESALWFSFVNVYFGWGRLFSLEMHSVVTVWWNPKPSHSSQKWLCSLSDRPILSTINCVFLGSFPFLDSHYSLQKIFVFPRWECESGIMVVIKTLLQHSQ